jgi:hypothetical protein
MSYPRGMRHESTFFHAPQISPCCLFLMLLHLTPFYFVPWLTIFPLLGSLAFDKSHSVASRSKVSHQQLSELRAMLIAPLPMLNADNC